MMDTINETEANLNYDSCTDYNSSPPVVDIRQLARQGIHVLLNDGGVLNAQMLFQKYKKENVLLSAGASLVDFIAAAMSFEDEKMEIAQQSLKFTIKMCDIDSCFEGMIHKRPSHNWSTAERIERMIIWADCELFLAFIMFLKQGVVDFIKAGFHMRKAWKMYEKCYLELYGCEMNSKTSKKNNCSTPSSLSNEEAKYLTESFSFGYGLVQIALSVVPATLLKFCEVFGFHVNKEVGLSSLLISSNSNDMKSPIARLTLLWYHTIVCPFCNVDGENLEKGLKEAAEVLKGSEEEFPTSTIFIYFRALLCRLRGNLEESLNLLSRTVSTNSEQKEIILLCCYDKGWCHLLKMEWNESFICFSKLQQESKWSEAYYAYLLALTSGALNKLGEAFTLLKSVPKKVVRKTQLEVYLTRKCHLYKNSPPNQVEYIVLIFELLYLWNSLPQCTEDGLRAMMAELEKCHHSHMNPIKYLIMGAIHSKLCERAKALMFLEQASVQCKTKPTDAHVIPFAMYEMALIYAKDEKTWQLSKEMLCKVKDTFKNYDFENRLLFRIHAVLNSLEDKETIRLGQLKLTSPNFEGI
ncbi:tetratricopeptide repeat protein 39C isoform X1 [Hydra vulgaris]|nr:tetratricopeptide repeat protein 39C isoform X1 [Hydra vulgaris]XP_047139627.1 tetratricopeptide repeat protein 39C isoform X1 [Hydra vulgaris]